MYYITVTSNKGIPCEAPLWNLIEEELSSTISSDHPLVIRCPTFRDACTFIGAARSSAHIDKLEMSGRRPAMSVLAAAQVAQHSESERSRVEILMDSVRKSVAQVRSTLQLQ